jgi:cell division protein FtsQ
LARELDLSAIVPSLRSLAVGAALVAAAATAYVLARETSAFAVRRVEVQGAPPAVATRVERALRPVVGKSLVSLSAARVEARVLRLPAIVSARVDRSFPSTLKVFVRAERPVAVVRQGAHAWLASARARVLRVLVPRAHPELPRVWLPATAAVSVGATVADGDGGLAVRALAPLGRDRFMRRVVLVRADSDQVVFVLRSGVELVLGNSRQLPLKLAIARQVLAADSEARYVDVSLPGRVATATRNPQVEGRGLDLSAPISSQLR